MKSFRYTVAKACCKYLGSCFWAMVIFVVLFSACQTEQAAKTEAEASADTLVVDSALADDAQVAGEAAGNPAYTQESEPPAAPEVVAIRGKQLELATGEILKTFLYEAEYLGTMGNAANGYFLVLSGRPCTECDANRSIYLHNPEAGDLDDEFTAPRFPFPGKERFYEDGTLLSESRFFFGEIMPNAQGAIWFTDDYALNAGQPEQRVLLVQPQADTLAAVYLPARQIPNIQQTQAQVAQGKAFEVPGEIYFSEP